MIPIVGCPAECQFGQIPRSDYHTSGFVRQIHQQKGTLSCLCIFVSNIMDTFILPDFLKMQPHRFADIDFLQFRTHLVNQLPCIVIGSVRCPKAWHCHRLDVLSWQSQHIKGSHRHQQGKCRIQTAGDTDYRSLRACMLISLFQAICLNRENLLTAFLSGRFIGWHERRSVKLSA